MGTLVPLQLKRTGLLLSMEFSAVQGDLRCQSVILFFWFFLWKMHRRAFRVLHHRPYLQGQGDRPVDPARGGQRPQSAAVCHGLRVPGRKPRRRRQGSGEGGGEDERDEGGRVGAVEEGGVRQPGEHRAVQRGGGEPVPAAGRRSAEGGGAVPADSPGQVSGAGGGVRRQAREGLLAGDGGAQEEEARGAEDPRELPLRLPQHEDADAGRDRRLAGEDGGDQAAVGLTDPSSPPPRFIDFHNCLYRGVLVSPPCGILRLSC